MGKNCCKPKNDEKLEIRTERDNPTLICFYEHDNEEQKNYCLKLRDNFKDEKTINYEIKSIPKVHFKIQIIYQNKEEILQDEPDYSDSAMEITLRKAYDFLKSID